MGQMLPSHVVIAAPNVQFLSTILPLCIGELMSQEVHIFPCTKTYPADCSEHVVQFLFAEHTEAGRIAHHHNHFGDVVAHCVV